jgi:hypothetical protein
MYKQTINDHLTALGDVDNMFIVVEYNNPTYPESTTYNIAHGSDLRLEGGMNFLHDVNEGTVILSYENLEDAQKMCKRLNYAYYSTKQMIGTGH